MAKTGDIKNFVLVEEAGIAKGIRRMIAVTGEDARTAAQHATDAEAKLGSIERLPLRERDAALKPFANELGALEVSAVRKAALRERYTKACKAVVEELKQRGKVDNEKAGLPRSLLPACLADEHPQALETVNAFLKDHPTAPLFVATFDVGSNVKVRQPA